MRRLAGNFKSVSFTLWLLAFSLACSYAATPTLEPTATTAPATEPAPAEGETPQPTATTAPVAEPTPTTAPSAAAPSGELNVGLSELGPFAGHPQISTNPEMFVFSTAIGEGLVSINQDLQAVPMLAESWDISS
jgi:ABC-type transport system substrate-binding protein